MPANSSSEWSFNLRTGAGASGWDSSSSDSESDARGGTTKAERTSGNAQEKGDDITLEAEEAVNYKRNPFSIAKINAAIRGDSQRATTNTATSNELGKENPIVNPQKIINADQLKRQAMKSTPISKPPSTMPPAQPIRPRLTVPAQVPDSNNASRTTRFNQNNPPTLPPAASKLLPLRRSPQPANKSLLSSKPSSRISRELQQRSSNAPLIATFTRFTQPNGYRNLTPASSYRKFGQNATSYAESAFDDSFASSSRPGPKFKAKTYDITPFSSPSRVYSYDASDADLQYFSSPALPESRQSLHDPGSSTTAPLAVDEMVESRNFSSRPQQEGAYTQCLQDDDTFFSSTDAPVASSTYHTRAVSPASSISHLAQTSEFSSKHPDAPTKRSSLGRPIRPKKDAYDLRLGDPDEEFSTLTVKKKQKLAPSPVKVKRTQKFRIPALTGQLPPGTRTGMSATSGKRVITFLPPPLPPKDTRHSERGRVVRRGSQAYPSPKRSDDSPVVSSSPPNSPVGSSTCGAKTTTLSGRNSAINRFEPPSPPPSDDWAYAPQSPLNNLYDAEMDFDINSISGRYMKTKAARRERRRLSDGVWDILDLPSCGVIYRDKHDEDLVERGGDAEIAIVKWSE